MFVPAVATPIIAVRVTILALSALDCWRELVKQTLPHNKRTTAQSYRKIGVGGGGGGRGCSRPVFVLLFSKLLRGCDGPEPLDGEGKRHGQRTHNLSAGMSERDAPTHRKKGKGGYCSDGGDARRCGEAQAGRMVCI